MAAWYTAADIPTYRSDLRSAQILSEFQNIETAFSNFPTLSGNGSKGLAVNSGGTAIEALSASSFRTLIGVGTGDSPTFTGVTTTNFTLGGTAVTATGTEINYLSGASSNIQTQLNALSGIASAPAMYIYSHATFGGL